MKSQMKKLASHYVKKLVVAFNEAFKQIAEAKKAADKVVGLQPLFITAVGDDYMDEEKIENIFKDLKSKSSKWYTSAYQFGLSGVENGKYLSELTQLVDGLLNFNFGAGSKVLDTQAWPALRELENKLQTCVPTTVAAQKAPEVDHMKNIKDQTMGMGRRADPEGTYEYYEPGVSQNTDLDLDDEDLGGMAYAQ